MQLQELKKELEQCQIDLHICQNLLERRESELQKIQALKEQVSSQLIQMHRLMAANPNKAEALKQNIEAETEKISRLKESLKNIDAELDRLGEEKESSCVQLKQNLIAKIQEKFPDTSLEYQTISKRLEEAQHRFRRLVQQKKVLEPLFGLLREGDQVNIKRGFFDFIVGRNSKVLLARVIHRATPIAEKIDPKILDERSKRFLEKFLKEAHKTWNHALYRGQFSELFREFSGLMSELEQEIVDMQETITKQEQALENWIDKNCIDS